MCERETDRLGKEIMRERERERERVFAVSDHTNTLEGSLMQFEQLHAERLYVLEICLLCSF